MQIDIKRIFANAIARRIAYLLIATVLALISQCAHAYQERWFHTQYPNEPRSSPAELCAYIVSTNQHLSDAPYSLIGIDSPSFHRRTCRMQNKNGVHLPTNINLQYRCVDGSGSWINATATPPACYVAPEVCEAGRVLDSISVSNVKSVSPNSVRCINNCLAPVKTSLLPQRCYPATGGAPANCVTPAFFEWVDNGQECSGGSDPWATADPNPPEAPAPEPPNCPECECLKKGMSYGSVNGATVCVPKGTPGSPPVTTEPVPKITTTTPAPTSENPNPEPVTTVTGGGGSGVTVGGGGSADNPSVTEQGTNEDGSTWSETTDKDSFCSKNPSHPQCKQQDFCKENPDSLACTKLGDVPVFEPVEVKEVDIGLITLPQLNEAGGCPAPLSISLGGRTITISFAPICQYAEAFRPLVIAAAWISAAFLVFGMRTD